MEHRLLGPPVADTLAVGPPPPPPADPPEDRLDSDGADWGTFTSPCVAFFLADGDTPPQRLRALLAAAWDHDADTTLKLVCNHRGVRGTGKGNREIFYTAALWMKKTHPFTLAANLPAFADFGYIKDLPELLYRLVRGADVRKVQKEKSEAWARAKATNKLAGRKHARGHPAPDPEPTTKSMRTESEEHAAGGKSQPAPGADDDDKAAKKTDDDKAAKKTDDDKAAKKTAWLAAQALRMYNDDIDYHILFDVVADFFAYLLKCDLDKVAAGEERNIGLAAKWCPSVNSSFDKSTLLCEGIARRMFPNPNLDAAADPQEERNYVYRALNRLRHEVLKPLRKLLELPEVYISANRWSELPYNRVATRAMNRYAELFLKHDHQRYSSFIAGREVRKAKIAAAAGAFRKEMLTDAPLPLPHNIIGSLVKGVHSEPVWKYQMSWNRFVEHHRGKGKFHNCIAVCDLSDNVMDDTQRNVCLAFGLLVSKLAEDPWEDLWYPMSADRPQTMPDGGNISERLKNVLEIACENNKEFEESLACRWTARDHKKVCEDFIELGYPYHVPQVVYWNLAGRRSAALTSTRDGVMRISGYSDNFFRLFLECGGIVEQDVEMEASIKGSDYDRLVVLPD